MTRDLRREPLALHGLAPPLSSADLFGNLLKSTEVLATSGTELPLVYPALGRTKILLRPVPLSDNFASLLRLWRASWNPSAATGPPIQILTRLMTSSAPMMSASPCPGLN